MRKLYSLVLAVCLFAPVMAGEVNTPGKTDPPPPCTENCTNSTVTIATEAGELTIEEQIEIALLELVLAITRL